jgi:hypothetical protein
MIGDMATRPVAIPSISDARPGGGFDVGGPCKKSLVGA